MTLSENKLAIIITEDEYNSSDDGRGTITSEHDDGESAIRRSFMWNRTLMWRNRLFIEGFNMAIVK